MPCMGQYLPCLGQYLLYTHAPSIQSSSAQWEREPGSALYRQLMHYHVPGLSQYMSYVEQHM
jgi:hypothetical protein